MDLPYNFVRLPLAFDAERLAEEASVFSEEDWRAHPSGFTGNSALQFISTDGDLSHDRLQGEQLPTPHLERCPYIRQVLASFDTVLGRTRLMRLAPNSEAKAHMDASYYWHQRLRIHIPIQTHPDITFFSGDSSVHMGAGESWVFNTWNMHSVQNDTEHSRIHIVADTVGSAALWDLIEKGVKVPGEEGLFESQTKRFISYHENSEPELLSERYNFPSVMSPWEQSSLLAPMVEDLLGQKEAPSEVVTRLAEILKRFSRQWYNHWSHFGPEKDGTAGYQNLLDSLKVSMEPLVGKLYLSNGMEATGMVEQAVIHPALHEGVGQTFHRAQSGGAEEGGSIPAPRSQRLASEKLFQQPVFIVCAPRSGSSFLHETLTRSPDFYTVGGESHGVFEGVPKLRPVNRLFESNQLAVEDADPQTSLIIQKQFQQLLRDRDGKPPNRNQPVRLLEKTPKNALRIPFLNAVFPDALFVYLYRQPADSFSSIIEAWESDRFVTYRELPGWPRSDWSLLLTPGWRELAECSLAEIAADQWARSNRQIMDDLKNIDATRWMALSYESLLENTKEQVDRICEFAGVRWDDPLNTKHPLSGHTVSEPAPEKWRTRSDVIEPLLPSAESVVEDAKRLIAESQEREYPRRVIQDPMQDPKTSPLRSSFTSNFIELLHLTNSSIAVTTYQAGKLVLLRKQGDKMNTHFHNISRPMGMAIGGDNLAIGTRNGVEFFVDVPVPAEAKTRKGRYVRRLEQVTGNIDIHEMSFTSSELWLVNTKFSCLCTLDLKNNFVPRWKPDFISDLRPEDRCHLNGLCVVDDTPKYVSALGVADKAGGWRDNRASGGVIIDVASQEFVTQGLSMPHSPRWYRGALWILESGKGSLAQVDVKTGQITTVAELPGFTRGLTFYKNLAFIGLSEVRETAVFGSIPITERISERTCGVWVVDIDQGKVVSWLKFEGDVNEVFAVDILADCPQAEIVQSHEEALDNTFVTPRGAVIIGG